MSHYVEHMEQAIDKIDQAISSVSYLNYPDKNKEIKDELDNIMIKLEQLKNRKID